MHLWCDVYECMREYMRLTLSSSLPHAHCSMPYFFSQDPDYVTVKETVANQCANGVEAEGIATIDTGIETLRVAEYLKPLLADQLGS